MAYTAHTPTVSTHATHASLAQHKLDALIKRWLDARLAQRIRKHPQYAS